METETAYAQLYMDSGLNHSSGYFIDDGMSLERAQSTKIRAILETCRIQPGMRLLDVGCGWGTASRMAASEWQADVTGITLSAEQCSYAREQEGMNPAARRVDFRVQKWEDFNEPVDRIICINAFENFDNKKDFLKHCRSLLPVGGVVVLLTVTADRPLFRVLSRREIIERGECAGFDISVSDSLAGYYIETLMCFVRNLRSRRQEAVSLIGAERVGRHLDYYSKCADFLRRGLNDMYEFTCVAQ